MFKEIISFFSIYISCVLFFLFSLNSNSVHAESNVHIDSLHLQEKILEVVDKVKPTLIRIHVVEKYYSEGRELKQEKFGSGVVISPEGYVVTNHHVAGKAFIADCTFSNLKKYPLQLIGTDALTDITVLKIIQSEEKEFKYTEFGDSDAVKVGDYVLAMGSPMALNPSVTLGIISNTQMVLPYRLESFEMFTDENENIGSLIYWLGHNAEISQGSSGGPLVNLNGEIIGINEIKYALGGAIPSNVVKKVVHDIIWYGKVQRSWVGIEVQPSANESNSNPGALIRYIYPNSPAQKAGLQYGDIIVQINDNLIDIQYMEQIPGINNILTSLPVNTEVTFRIIRGGEYKTFTVIPEVYSFTPPEEKEIKELGCTIKNINWIWAVKRNRKDTNGVLISSIRTGGRLAQAKPPLQEGDIIIKINGSPVNSIADLEQLINNILSEKNEKNLFMVDRKGDTLFSVVTISPTKPVESIREATKPWIPVEVQVLTTELAEKMDVDAGGFVVSRVYPETLVGKVELLVGDIIKGIEDRLFTAKKATDYDEWKENIRAFSENQTVQLSIIRKGQSLTIPVKLIPEPIPKERMEKYQDEWLEFTIRDLCFYDYKEMNLPPETKGVIVEQVIPGGWASLAKLEQGDIIISIDNQPVSELKSVKEILNTLKQNNANNITFQIKRGIQMYFVNVAIK